ncbi:hypothetical protein D081_2391 [Anaerovibrio sp. JC8]|nr:hypothetical protein D081_2391 [Anaerovibrio sp. JC8]
MWLQCSCHRWCVQATIGGGQEVRRAAGDAWIRKDEVVHVDSVHIIELFCCQYRGSPFHFLNIDGRKVPHRAARRVHARKVQRVACYQLARAVITTIYIPCNFRAVQRDIVVRHVTSSGVTINDSTTVHISIYLAVYSDKIPRRAVLAMTAVNIFVYRAVYGDPVPACTAVRRKSSVNIFLDGTIDNGDIVLCVRIA